MCAEIESWLEKKGLTINPEDPNRYFYAILWRNSEDAAKDAVLIFYSIMYDEAGKIQDAEYNFVERWIFNKTY